MSKEALHRNNPLQGVGLKAMLEELVNYYGFDILHAYLNMNCFKANPSIPASIKFLKKTDWARAKVEVFYLYQYKNLPAVSSEQFNVAPRERVVPEHHKPGQPAVLSIEDGERLQHKRTRNVASRDSYASDRRGSSRVYNDQHGSHRFRPADNHQGSNDSDRADGRQSIQSGENATDDEPVENTPVPPLDPWANGNPWANAKKKK